MNAGQLRKIRAVEARPGYRVAVTWEHGQGRQAASVVDLSELVSLDGVFTSLANPILFGAVRVGENRRVIVWPEPKDEFGQPVIEIDADALCARLKAQQEKELASLARGTFKPAAKRARHPASA